MEQRRRLSMSFSNIMDSNSYTADGDDDPLIVGA